jgi:uncharacterized SAM-binding protein YcdF (DUF218 family)
MSSLSVKLAPSRFLDPAVLVVVFLAVALYFAFRGTHLERRARVARAVAWGTWAALWILSTPYVCGRLTSWTEMRGPDLRAALAGKDPDHTALVVLAAGLRTYDESLPPRERLDAASTQRVLAAARLWKEHHFGLVILSGAPAEETRGMLDLAVTLGVPRDRVVLEPRSDNTRENARESAAILRARPGFEDVVLVTSATHLRRAIRDFANAGVQVIPAAADVVGPTRLQIDCLLPSSHGLARTHIALHELLGMVRG